MRELQKLLFEIAKIDIDWKIHIKILEFLTKRLVYIIIFSNE